MYHNNNVFPNSNILNAIFCNIFLLLLCSIKRTVSRTFYPEYDESSAFQVYYTLKNPYILGGQFTQYDDLIQILKNLMLKDFERPFRLEGIIESLNNRMALDVIQCFVLWSFCRPVRVPSLPSKPDKK